MSNIIIVLSEKQFNRFLFTGCLASNLIMQYTPDTIDLLFVNCNNMLYGPFEKRLEHKGHYSSKKENQYLFTFGLTAPLGHVMWEHNVGSCQISNETSDAILKQMSREYYDYVDETVTGCHELDGLLSTAFYDTRKRCYVVHFAMKNYSFREKYLSMLMKAGIECRGNSNGDIEVDNSEICEKTKHLDRKNQMYNTDYVAGFIAPYITFLDNTLGDDAPDYCQTIFLIDPVATPDIINEYCGSEVLFAKDSYQRLALSMMCNEIQPFRSWIPDNNRIEEQISKNEENDLDELRFKLALTVTESIFEYSGYTVLPKWISDYSASYHINRSEQGNRYYADADILILPRLDAKSIHSALSHPLPDAGIIMLIDSAKLLIAKIGSIQDLTNRQKISLTELFENLCSNPAKAEHLETQMLSVEHNAYISLVDGIVMELNHKLNLIWSS